jgi:hypothetical protein
MGYNSLSSREIHDGISQEDMPEAAVMAENEVTMVVEDGWTKSRRRDI